VQNITEAFHFTGSHKQCTQNRQRVKDYCCSPELHHGKKYKYLKNFPVGSLIPLYLTSIMNGKYISMVIIVPLHFGYVKGDYCSSKEEAEERAAKMMLDKLQY